MPPADSSLADHRNSSLQLPSSLKCELSIGSSDPISLPYKMMGEPVQFRLYEREQLFQRSLVSAAPVGEQLGNLLPRGLGGVVIQAVRRREF
jgi:hypothetical protein